MSGRGLEILPSNDERLREIELEVARIQERSESNKVALQIARDDITHRLNRMNEMRDQIESERGDYLHIDRFEVLHSELIRRVENLEAWKNNITGRAVGLSFVAALLLAVIGALITHNFIT